ncbi:hypothetical protein BDV95DRAFT_610692 [Massariosphaeria phaeospora]|uniref:Ubiquitin-like domain-containing protein n=1 Tax=Massariosphaeria phaeospora TaxID=100035 RepID=A0A7C8I4G1_9PLEO|nr:hypothetical protein BDV95DRAFT_610692 [Massariosphaeria phaeospora]
MAITFGSFGDIIAAVQVAYKLVEILSAQRGAKREFSELIVDLRLFHRFLDHLSSFWQTRERGPQLDSLFDILQPVICDAKGEINTLLEKIISKYGKSLTAPSKHNPKDVAKMLQWHMAERDGIARLQDKLRKSKEVILMVQSQANTILEEKNKALIHEKFQALMDAEAEATTYLDTRLDALEDEFYKQTAILNRIYDGIGSVSTALAPIARAAIDIPTMLGNIYTELLAQRALHRTLNPYAQNSAVIEDALGWKFEIPLDLIVSWDTLHSIFLDKFKERPGYQLIQARRYVMRDDLNGLELRRSVALNSAVRPGQKVNMVMVFFKSESQITVCPRCKKSSLQTNDTDITCLTLGCNMEIQRFEDVTDTEHLENSIKEGKVSIVSKRDGTLHRNVDDIEDNPDIDFDAKILKDFVHLPPTEDSVEVFKRIRYISRWEDRSESRGSVQYRTGQYKWWDCQKSAESHTIMNVSLSYLQTTMPKDLLPSTLESWRDHLFVYLKFIGTSVEQSRPMLMLFSTKKWYRKEAWKCLRNILWIKAHPSLILITSGSRLFYPDAEMLFEEHTGVKESGE